VTALGEKVVSLHRALAKHRIPHAIGGAIALAYAVNEARATHDVDMNVFVSTERVEEVLGCLPEEIEVRPRDVEALRRDGQVRLRWGDNPVDLFLSTTGLHDAAATRTRMVPFERTSIPILSATDLAVCKAVYGRGKDWVDIESMRDAGAIDSGEALEWVARILGPGHRHYRQLFAILGAPPAPRDGTDLPPPPLRAQRGGRGARRRG
jgi:hypothetical protein